MIIAECFEGDSSIDAARMQHECYFQALSVMVEECNRLTLFARNLLSDQTHKTWGTVQSFDHRTLQNAHDVLAAVWRYRACSTQGSLPFEGGDPWAHPAPSEWLGWLRSEVSSWIDTPDLVVAVQVILTSQNIEPGYRAEQDLMRRLLARFSEVPWTRYQA